MTRVFNQTSEKEKRRELRSHLPKAETILWGKIRDRKILGYKFRRQYSVGAFVIDFYCPVLRLAIEIDGDSHFQEGSAEYDRERERTIESFGIRFLRFRNVEIFENLQVVLDAIDRTVRGMANTPL